MNFSTEQLRAEFEEWFAKEVLKDAARYRWLRGNRDAQLPNGCITDIYDSDGAVLFYEELDDAIDAAMAAAQGEGRTGA